MEHTVVEPELLDSKAGISHLSATWKITQILCMFPHVENGDNNSLYVTAVL